MTLSETVLFFKELNPFILKAKYLQGVPNLNENFTVRFVPHKDGIEFQNENKVKKLFLRRDKIKNISVEDQNSIQSRVGFARLLMLGIFAFAWKKKETIPLSFLVFQYDDGFGELLEMYIQSEEKDGFQTFTNIKYNLKNYWREADENSNFYSIVNSTENIHQKNVDEKNKQSLMGCLFIVILSIIFYFIFFK